MSFHRFKTSFLLMALLLGASSAWSNPGLNVAWELIKKTGFNPNEQIEKLAGLKVLSCRFSGVKHKVESNEFGKCLLYAAIDYDQSMQARPIQLSLASKKSGKTLVAQLDWKPLNYAINRDSWLNWVPTNYWISRIGEFHLLMKYYLMNDIKLSFENALTVDDLSLPTGDIKLNALSALQVDEILLMTTPSSDELTLSGFLEFKNQNAAIFRLFFKTNWKAFQKAPFKADIHGRLIPVTNGNLGVAP